VTISAAEGPPRPRTGPPPAGDRTGPARVDLRGARLEVCLAPGEVAVVDRLDLDLVAAHAILSRRPVAVINVTSSASGRAPGLGAAALVAAGVRVVDDAGPGVLAAVDDGDVVTVTADGQVRRDGVTVVTGRVLDEPAVARAMQAGRSALGAQVAAFGAAAAGVLDADGDALLPPGDEPVPDLAAVLAGTGGRGRRRARVLRRRPVLVVAGGPRTPADLAVARRRLPAGVVVVATPEGADVALGRGLRPDVVVGDGRRLTARVLAAGPVVVHLVPPAASPRDVAEARERLDRSAAAVGSWRDWRTGLAAAEAAVVLGHAAGAPVVVTAGAPHGLLEFADRPPRAMAGAALVAAAVGHRTVDPAALAVVARPPVGWGAGAVTGAAGLVALGVALAVLAGWVPGDWRLPDGVAEAVRSLAALVPSRPAGVGAEPGG